MKVAAIVLTLNEERHLARCLESLANVAADVFVVDSFSTDKTREIAVAYGATIIQHPWVNPAVQFNWALSQVPADADWVLRIDADEYLSAEMKEEVLARLPSMSEGIDGVTFVRRVVFQGKLIRFGGIGSIRILRLFRRGKGHCEVRWMDEHIKVSGATVDFRSAFIDENMNSLTWWTAKHNAYASREAIDLLNLKYRFIAGDGVANGVMGSQAGRKRWAKERVYSRLPKGFRALAYFIYRYVVLLGVLDGRRGATFHVLQGLWYRLLVDAKVDEVERYMAANDCLPAEAVAAVLDIQLSP